MTALRNMNSKLKNEINKLMKKWGKIRILEETSSQIQKKFENLFEIISNLYLD